MKGESRSPWIPGRRAWPIWLALAAVGTATAESPSELAPIVYVDRGQLCSVHPSGDGGAHCRNSQKEFGSPSWRPDGSILVTERGIHDGPRSLALLDRRGRLIRALAGSSDHFRPAWSPEGRYIFALDYDLGAAVARWTADGLNRMVVPAKLPDGKQNEFQRISFSPSGHRAALLTMEFREMVIVRVSETELAAEKTLPSGFSYVSQSVWLDEKHLLFVGKRQSDRGELWELNLDDGSTVRRGIGGLWLRDQIAISPDHASVVVSASPNVSPARWNLYRFTLSTGAVVRLTTGSGNEDVDPTWRP